MPAYYLVDIREIKDPGAMEQYRAGINAVVEKFRGPTSSSADLSRSSKARTNRYSQS